jgi:hypothetical protein
MAVRLVCMVQDVLVTIFLRSLAFRPQRRVIVFVVEKGHLNNKRRKGDGDSWNHYRVKLRLRPVKISPFFRVTCRLPKN